MKRNFIKGTSILVMLAMLLSQFVMLPQIVHAMPAVTSIDDVSAGQFVKYGDYTWKMLDQSTRYMIKTSSIGSKVWVLDDGVRFSCLWGDSDICKYLNEDYYNSLPHKDWITDYTWNVGHHGDEGSATWTGKISLLSADELSAYDAAHYTDTIGAMGGEWTRTRAYDSEGSSEWDILTYDDVRHGNTGSGGGTAAYGEGAIYPALHLQTGLTVYGGTGTEADPYSLEPTAPVLSGTVNLSIDPATGAVTASATGGTTATAGTLTYTWSGGAAGTGTTATPTLGAAATCTVTGTGATGSIQGTVTVYKTAVTKSGNTGTDTASITNTYGKAGDAISITYTLDSSGTASNTLTYSGVASEPTTVNTASSGTSSYTIASGDATNGIISLTATFDHINSLTVNTIDNVSAGDYVNFGGYTWRMLDPTTRYMITTNQVNTMNWSPSFPASAWDISNPAVWLNSTFFNGLSHNSWITDYTWDITGLGDGTQQTWTGKIALLSSSEVNLYNSIISTYGRFCLTRTLANFNVASMIFEDARNNNTNGHDPSLSIYWLHPALHLQSGLTVYGGSGTSADPYILEQATPALNGTVNLSIDPATGAVTANATGGTTATAGTLTYTWSGGAAGTGTTATPTLGTAATCTVTGTGATGSIQGTVTVYKATITKSGNTGTDTASITNTYGKAGDTVSITYTLDSSGTASNTLTYSGAASSPLAVSTAGSGTSNYILDGNDATGGIIGLTATFAHTNTQAPSYGVSYTISTVVGIPPMALSYPQGVVCDSQGNLYIVDTNNHNILKVNATTKAVSTIIDSASITNFYGSGQESDYYYPIGIAVDSRGNVYIADNGNGIILKADSTGSNISKFVVGGSSVAVDSNDNIYIFDSESYLIKRFDKDGVSLGSIDLSNAGLSSVITGFTVDGSGNIYLVDTGNQMIVKVTSDGTVSTVAGTYGTGYSGEGVPATSTLNNPVGVAVDGSGNLYIVEAGFLDDPRIRIVEKTSDKIFTIAGNGNYGYNSDQDNAPALLAEIGYSSKGAITVDKDGNVYFTDEANNILRKLAPNVILSSDASLTTVAGQALNANGSGDGSSIHTPITGTINVPISKSALGLSDIVVASHGTFRLFNDSNNSNEITGSNTIPLTAGGTTTVYIEVSSQDGRTVKYYEVAITTPATYTLTYIADANGSITGTRSQTVNEGDSGTTVTAVANPGCHFTGWSDGLATATRTDGDVGGNISVTANFAQDAPSGGSGNTGNNGGGSSSTTPSTPTTVNGDVIKENGEKVKGIPAQVTTDTNGTKAVEIKSQDAVLFKQADGTNSSISDYSRLSFSAPETTGTGTNTPSVILKSDGTIKVNNLANGSETKFEVTMDLGNGQKLVIGRMDVKVSQSGDVSLTSTLIDPYGVITDAVTGKVIPGVHVTLYFANTARNIANGKTPDTMVVLPLIDGFKPNNNIDPQFSDANGAYGWMVFPTSDYYIVATKEGYNNYKSPTISVEQEIVKFDFSMNKTNLSKPTITLNGAADSTLKWKEAYIEQGATAVDSNGVDFTKQIIASGAVDVTKVGDYTITYSVKDATGNEATAMRTVHVINRAKPVIKLRGAAEMTILQGVTFLDPGALATDNAGNDLTGKITTDGKVNAKVYGDYTLAYDVVDQYGNKADTVTRTIHVINTTKPILKLRGNAVMTLQQGAVFSDPGATAADNAGNDLTDKITVSGSVDTKAYGDYRISYNVTDQYGIKAKTVTRNVQVISTAKPVIKLKGNAEITILQGAAFSDPGAMAADNAGSDISSNIKTSGMVNGKVFGDYTIAYNVVDQYGNKAATVTRTVHVINTAKPVIKIMGDAEMTILQGAAFSDPGATAVDNAGRDISASIKTSGKVNGKAYGDYTITYNVSDQYGNKADAVTRTIHVINTAKPIIKLTGEAEVTILQEAVYSDPGATAVDNTGRDISASINAKGIVDTKVYGDYTISYNVTDQYGNRADTVTRTIHVINTAKPVIKLAGEAELTIQQGAVYSDPGAIAVDNADKDITSGIVADGTVNASVLGDYVIAYNVMDPNGIKADTVKRTVHVINTTKPVIKLNGRDDLTIPVKASYQDAGATARDNQNADITSNIVVSGKVDTKKAGDYRIAYTVTDSYGNIADQISRTVHVLAAKVTVAVQKKPLTAVLAGSTDGILGSVLASKTHGLVIKPGNYSVIKTLRTIHTTYILGGAKVISGKVEKQLRSIKNMKVIRLGGKNAYETSRAIIKYLGIGKSTPVILFSSKTSRTLVQAAIEKNTPNYPIVYTTSDVLNAYARLSLQELKPSKLYILGDRKALNTAVLKEIGKIVKNTVMVKAPTELAKLK